MPKFIFDLLAPIYDKLINGGVDKYFIDILKETKNGNILEIGAGTGRTAQIAIEYCNNLCLLDPSEKMLQRARSKLKKVKIMRGYVESTPFKENTFDLVYAIDSLHHWDDQKKGLNEINRILKPHGTFVLIDFDPTKKIGHYIRAMEKALFMGSKFYSINQIKDILVETNFTIMNSEFIEESVYLVISNKTTSQ